MKPIETVRQCIAFLRGGYDDQSTVHEAQRHERAANAALASLEESVRLVSVSGPMSQLTVSQVKEVIETDAKRLKLKIIQQAREIADTSLLIVKRLEEDSDPMHYVAQVTTTAQNLSEKMAALYAKYDALQVMR